MRKKTFLSLFFIYGCFTNLLGQNDDSLINKKYTIIPMPVLAANPTTGVVLGIAPGISWVNGNINNTSMSSFLGSLLYTTKNQLFIQARGNTFLNEDSWALTTDIRFNLNSQPTYGLSTNPKNFNSLVMDSTEEVSDDIVNGPSQKEMLGFNHFRFYQIIMKRYKNTRFFYGPGYHLDLMSNIEDPLLNLSNTEPTITHHYQYQTSKNLPLNKYSQSGISLNFSYDSRDNIANTYKGRLLSTSFRINPEFTGSTAYSNQLWIEYRDYFNLSKKRPRHLIAFWTYGWFVTSGKVPYLYLPATGWDMYSRSARPYTMGRFRGEDLVYSEAEWRFPLQKNKDKLGAVIFLNMTTASSREDKIDLFNYAQLGYGAGLRYMLSEKNRVNIGIDYGWGVHGASGLFLNLNEYF